MMPAALDSSKRKEVITIKHTNGKVGLMANYAFGAYKGGDCLTGECINGVYYVDGIVVTYGKEVVLLADVNLGYFN